MAHETVQGGRIGHWQRHEGLARLAETVRPCVGRWAPALAGLALLLIAANGRAQSPAGLGPPLVPGAQVAQQPPPPERVPSPSPVAQPGAQPQPRPGETLPPPRRTDLLGGYNRRLELLPSGVKPPVGVLPRPSQETLRKLDALVGPFVDPETSIELVVGLPRLWVLKAVPFRYQIGDPRILSLEVLGLPTELSLIGQQVGSTTLTMWFGERDNPARQTILSFLVNVLPDPTAKERLERVYKALEDEINKFFPDSFVCLFLVGDKLVLSGEAKDAIEAVQILSIVRANSPTSQGGGASAIPVGQTNLNFNVGGLTPTGDQARQALENFIIQGETDVVNLLRIPGEQQVNLKVTVAEVNRAAARSIGINFSITNNQGITVFSQNTGGVMSNVPALLDNGQIPLMIEALRSVNLARSLAEPNLTTLNGLPATFFAGGEFPVPVVTGGVLGGLQGTSFVPFGVQLFFTPFVTDKDRIRLTVQATVSTRDLSTGSQVGNTNVAGLTARSVATTVELREGQTLAIGGLLQTNMGATTTRVPLFGDIPFLGQAFRRDTTQAGESELVLLVTPQLVHPMEPKEIGPLPGSDVFEPGDLEFYLLGRLESWRPYDYRSPVMHDINRMCAYRRCELLYFVGPHGHSDGR